MKKNSIKYPVNEYFLSVQGEGIQYGRLALFIRFGKCNLKCNFCDTKFALNEYEYLSLNRIKNLLKTHRIRTGQLIITGGEPLLYDLNDIINYAKKLKYKIFVETNGTLYQEWLEKIDWIVVSPKRDSQQNKHALELANELKFVIQKRSDFKFVEKFMPFNPAYLMPVSNDMKMADMIFNYLKKSKFKNCLRLGIQLHKAYNMK